MARLEGLLIQGIRSFGPDEDRQIIHFKTPLTCIVGRNGCGKTTIIEALKYATIGEMPFGQGAAFIHDPKMAREMKVKAQIKLEISAVNKKLITVTRNLTGTQRAKKLEVQSMDNTLQSKDPVTGEKADISSRCADINELMIDSLGVSKSILSNVIFCHQEDSYWPLEEGKKLKERFDDIFDSTVHNHCLEDIRKTRKTVLEELKRMKLEIVHLKEKKDIARNKRLELKDAMKRHEELLVKIGKSEERLATLESDFRTLNTKHQDYSRIEANLERKKAQFNGLEEQQKQLLDCIKTEFVGSKEDLEVAIRDFQTSMSDMTANRDRFELQVRRLKASDNDCMKSINNETSKLGGLEAEVNLHEQRIKERNKKLQCFVQRCELSRIGDLPTESDVQQSLTEAKEHMSDLNNRLDFMRNQHDEEEKRLQIELDEKRVKITQLEQEIKGKDITIKTTKRDIAEKKSKLSEVDSCASRLHEVEAQVEVYRADVERIKDSVDVDSLKEQISTLKDACGRLEVQQTAVNEEVRSMMVHASNQNKLNELQKQQNDFSSRLRKYQNKNKDGLERLLKNPREGFMNLDLQKVLRTLDENIKRDTQRIVTQEQEITSVTMQRSHKRDQLSQFEEELKTSKEKMYQLCGSKTIDVVIEEEEKKLEKLQEDTGMLSSSEHIYKNYIRKLQDNDPCCPLCQRNFDSQMDASMLVEELNNTISSLPTKLTENKETIQTIRSKLNKLLEMRPTSVRMLELEKKIIPNIKSELTELEGDLDSKNQELAVLKASVIVPQENLTLGRSMLSDVGVMDQLTKDLKTVNLGIEDIKRKLPSGGQKRTIEEAQAEDDLLRAELSDARMKREGLEIQLQKHRETLNNLEQKLNQKVTEQLEIKALVQQRVQIEERLSELQMVLTTLENERVLLQNDLVPVSAEMEAALELMRNTRRTHRTQMEEFNKEIVKKRGQLDEINNIQTDIRNREKKRFKDQIEEVQNEIDRLNRKRSECKESIEEYESKLKKILQDIASSHVKERELADNLQLRNKREEAEQLRKDVDRLTAELGSLNINVLLQKLKTMSDEIARNKLDGSKNEGMASELLIAIEDRKRELNQDIYCLADENYKKKFIDLKVHQLLEADLQKFYIAYDRAVMKFHEDKMAEINSIVKELWMRIYRGNDIDHIEIRADAPQLTLTAGAEKRRAYNYRVVQVKNEIELDMRGRCSAGQKVLASLIIRMALAETFSLQCGILTLDEPTTNLDEANIVSMSEAILEIVETRMMQDNFQLIIITHDTNFMKLLSRADFVSHYYDVYRDHAGHSVIRRVTTSHLDDE